MCRKYKSLPVLLRPSGCRGQAAVAVAAARAAGGLETAEGHVLRISDTNATNQTHLMDSQSSVSSRKVIAE